MKKVKISGPFVVAYWGFTLAVLTALAGVGHESWFVLGMWFFAFGTIWLTALLAALAGRRAPVHRGSYAWPTSSSPALPLVAAFALGALAYGFGVWFLILMPAPLGWWGILAVRDHKLRKRLLDQRVVDPAAPPTLATAGRPREIEPWPQPETGDGARRATG
jgi:hypothetical protein